MFGGRDSSVDVVRPFFGVWVCGEVVFLFLYVVPLKFCDVEESVSSIGSDDINVSTVCPFPESVGVYSENPGRV